MMKNIKAASIISHLIPSCIQDTKKNPKNKPFSPDKHRDFKKPGWLVDRLYHLLMVCNEHDHDDHGKKRVSDDLTLKLLIEKIHEFLYGDEETFPDEKLCTEFTVEMFKERSGLLNHPFRLLVDYFRRKEVDLECKKSVSEIVTHILGQMVNSRMIACEFLEQNFDLIDGLIEGLFNFDDLDDPCLALLYGSMVRISIKRSRIIARHVLLSETYVKKFLEVSQHANYTISSYMTPMLESLLTKHRSAVTEFLKKNCDWFFDDFNSKLLESQSMVTRFEALKLMSSTLTCLLVNDHDREFVMDRLLCSENILKTIMNLLREIEEKSGHGTKYKDEKLRAFEIFSFFVDNQNKTEKIKKILMLNKDKICKFLKDDLKIGEKDEQFEQFQKDRIRVIRKIKAVC